MPYELAGKTVRLVVDPHAGTVVGVENDDGESLGARHPTRCARQPPPQAAQARRRQETTPPAASSPNLIELTHRRYHQPEGN